MTDFPVNSFTAGIQEAPTIAMDADGDFVIAWASIYQDGSASGVYAQRFSAAGAPVGAEFRVNTTTAGVQTAPSVAMDADGDFVVTWDSFGQDGSYSGIFAQRYNAAGVAEGLEFRVNATADGDQRDSVVAMAAAGFVVAWVSDGQDGDGAGIYAQRFDAAGVAQGGEFRVNATTANTQSAPAVAMRADGGFVVAWHSNDQDGDAFGIYAQRYDAAGNPQGGEFRVNATTASTQGFPSVAMDADGDFVVTWQSYLQDGSGYGIYAQRYDAAGNAQGGEFRVNVVTANRQTTSSVAMDADGDFTVTWQSSGQDGSGYGIYARRFTAGGSPLGGEFRVNAFTTGTQAAPVVAMDADGDAAIAWQSAGQDGFASGIFLRSVTATGAAAPVVTLDLDAATAGQGSTVLMRAVNEARPALGTDVVISTVGVPALTGATLRLENRTDGTLEALRLSSAGVATADAAGIAVAWDAAAGVLTLSGAATPGAYEAVLEAVRYVNAGMGAAGSRTVAVQVTAGAEASQVARATVTIQSGFAADTQVNSFTDNLQSTAAIAMDADGDAVVAWQSFGQDGSNWGIYAQRFTAGVAQGGEFRVSGTTSGAQMNASVAMDADGDFVVTWQSFGQDGSSYGIYAQRFDAAGAAQGNEFLVNSFVAGSQAVSAVAMDADGDFVVTWASFDQDLSGWGIYAQRFNAAGVAQGTEFRVNSATADWQNVPSVAMDADGDFVVAWQSFVQDGSANGVYAQRYNAAGVAQGDEFRVNTATAGTQSAPAVAMDADGDFVIAWMSNGQDGSGYGIYAQRYDAAGAALGLEFRVNTTTASSQRDPGVAMDADGDFVVTWSSPDGSGYGVHAQRYNAAGVAVGGEFRLNAVTNGNQFLSAVAMDAAGGFAVAWDSSAAQDGSSNGVFARFIPSAAPRLTLDLDAATTGIGSSAAAVVGGAPAAVFGADVAIAGLGPTLTGATIRLATRPDGTAERLLLTDAATLAAADAGIAAAWDGATGTLTLSGSATLAAYEAALEGLRYANGAAVGDTAARTITVRVEDGLGASPVATATVAVTRRAEIQVNTATGSDQEEAAVAVDADGDFVVAWRSLGQDGSGFGVHAQRFNAAGVAQGNEFRVNTETAFTQASPTVAMDADGDFVVAWLSYGQDGSSNGTYAQRYDAAGIAQGGEFRVNSVTDGPQMNPAAAMDADGDFVVIWESQDGSGYGIYAQRYDAEGAARGNEFRVNTTTAGSQNRAAVAMDADGDFVVVWTSGGQDGPGYGVYGQRFSAAGVAMGEEFRVNTTTAGDQYQAAVAMGPDGAFVVTWTSLDFATARYSVVVQRFDAAGVAQGPETTLGATAFNRLDSQVTMQADGGFTVAWTSMNQDGDGNGIYAQRFDAAGVALGEAFRVNTVTALGQQRAALAADPDGDLVVTWDSTGQDGSGQGVFLKLLTRDGVPKPALDLDASAAGTGFATTFTRGGAPVAIADADAELLNSDATQITALTATLLSRPDGVAEGLSLSASLYTTFNVAWDQATGTLTVTGSGSEAEFEQALRAIVYDNLGGGTALGIRQVEVRFTDSAGGTSTAVSTITLLSGDTPPDAVDDSFAAAEDGGAQAGNVRANDTDADDPTSALVVTAGSFAGSWGTLALGANGAFTYTPGAAAQALRAGQQVTDAFTYTLADTAGLTDTATLTVTLTGANDAPTAIALSNATVAENDAGAAIGTLAVTDPDSGDTQSLGVSDSRFEVVAGVLKLKTGIDLDREATPTIGVTVTATDAGGLSRNQAFTITVANVNEAPTGAVTLGLAGAALTASSTLADPDGPGTIVYRWQGFDGGIWATIPGALGASFTPGAAQAGQLVRALASYTDGGGTAEEVASGTAARIGGAGADALATTAEAPILLGLNGNDSLTGGGAAETLDGGNGADSLAGGNGGDRLQGTAGNDSLDGEAGDDSLDGGSGNDALAGGAGADTMQGNIGADTMQGGDGDDLYILDSAADLAFEVGTGGVDEVRAAASVTLGAGIENLLLTGSRDSDGTGNGLDNRLQGTPGANLLRGEAGQDTLLGLGGTDTLLGGEGNDRLDGGTGADSLDGGLGDDTYLVDHAGDVAEEAGSGGLDQVLASVGFQLGAGIEILQLTGSAALDGVGNALANRLTGNAGANLLIGLEGMDTLAGGTGNDTLDGGEGNDRLDGNAGADSMAGGAGDDLYVVDHAGDAVTEDAAGGTDLVTATIGYVLPDWVEQLTLGGSAGIAGTGNALGNVLRGNAGANLLDGAAGADSILAGSGDDTLVGGAGGDTLAGGAGGDVFRYGAATEGGDVITDYLAAQDAIEVSAAGFGGLLPLGVLAADRFEAGSASATSPAGEGQFLWDAATRTLRWDADGGAPGGAVEIARFTGSVTLTAAEIVVIA